MSLQRGRKLNPLLKGWPHGTVYATSWLARHGVGDDLLAKYRKGGWVETVGRGAVARSGDKVDWTGGLYAIQAQLNLKIHAAARTALEMEGFAHFVPLVNAPITLFGEPGEKLPSWFRNYNWATPVNYVQTNLFPPACDWALHKKEVGTFSVVVSSPERAIMEQLYLVSERHSLEGARLLMQSLTTLRPSYVQKLLEKCTSVKVKRLVMALAEEFNHPWVKRVSLSKVDFGEGKRVLVKGGRLHPKYHITLPVPSPMA